MELALQKILFDHYLLKISSNLILKKHDQIQSFDSNLDLLLLFSSLSCDLNLFRDTIGKEIFYFPFEEAYCNSYLIDHFLLDNLIISQRVNEL